MGLTASALKSQKILVKGQQCPYKNFGGCSSEYHKNHSIRLANLCIVGELSNIFGSFLLFTTQKSRRAPRMPPFLQNSTFQVAAFLLFMPKRSLATAAGQAQRTTATLATTDSLPSGDATMKW